MKKTILSLTLLATCLSLQAQMEANNWFFGNGCGLSFNNTVIINDTNGVAVTGVPTTQTSPLYTQEGCFALSDENGNLLAFSDGSNVYNKNKNAIQTGLNGNSSSAQSGIVLPWPQRPGFYFIISNRQMYDTSGGLFYSVLDLNGNNGNGLVTNINTRIKATSDVPTGQMYENTMAVRHANNTDYWLVNRTGKYLFSWLVTKDGFASVEPEPTTVTTIPGTNARIPMRSEGYMKLSPDSKHLCHVNIDAPQGEVLFADFDNATGAISNIQIRNLHPAGPGTAGDPANFYGAEFSPNGKNIFFSQLYGGIWVMPVDEFMTATPKLVTVRQNGALQLGPDKRIYFGASYFSGDLGIIQNPDDDIANIKANILTNYLRGTPQYGLPTFASSFFNNSVCYKPAITTGTPEPIKTIISTLDRTAVPRNWLDPRAGSLILESKTRGMVLTRIANPQTDIANPVEGMIVFDTTANALKFYNGTVWKILEQSCPDN